MRRASWLIVVLAGEPAGLEPASAAGGRGDQGRRHHQAAARPGGAGDVGRRHAGAAGEGRGLAAHLCAASPRRPGRCNNADLFFRMSETVEPFTIKVVKSLPKRVEVVTLQDAPGLKLLAAAHRRDLRARMRTARSKAHGHGHSHATPHKGDAVDGHAWLDPDNAKVMVDRIEQALSAKYPAHAPAFKANAEALSAEARCAGGRARRRARSRSPASPTSSSTTPSSTSSAATA